MLHCCPVSCCVDTSVWLWCSMAPTWAHQSPSSTEPPVLAWVGGTGCLCTVLLTNQRAHGNTLAHSITPKKRTTVIFSSKCINECVCLAGLVCLYLCLFARCRICRSVVPQMWTSSSKRERWPANWRFRQPCAMSVRRQCDTGSKTDFSWTNPCAFPLSLSVVCWWRLMSDDFGNVMCCRWHRCNVGAMLLMLLLATRVLQQLQLSFSCHLWCSPMRFST